MNILVYVSFNHRNKEGLYRSVFSRVKEIRKSSKVDILDMVSVHDDYRFILKKISAMRGYINHFKKEEWGFVEENIRCNYIKITTFLIHKILERVNPDYSIKRIYKKVTRELDLNKYHMISVHSSYPNSCVVKMINDTYKIPYIVTLHGSDINVIPKKSHKIKMRVIESLEQAESCIFVSQALLNTAMGLGYSGKNAIVVPNGIDKNLFKHMDKDMVKKDMGIAGRRVIGYIGNLIHIKGADRLPAIFKNISDEEKDAKFVVIGDGVLRKKIEEECTALGLDVNFYGKIEPKEVPYYLNSMDVMLLPSRNEGWPCVVLEALACSVPVVGSDKGGIPEAIGCCGKVVKDGEGFIERFSKEVIEVLRNDKRQDYEEYVGRYTWDTLGLKELELIEKI